MLYSSWYSLYIEYFPRPQFGRVASGWAAGPGREVGELGVMHSHTPPGHWRVQCQGVEWADPVDRSYT